MARRKLWKDPKRRAVLGTVGGAVIEGCAGGGSNAGKGTTPAAGDEAGGGWGEVAPAGAAIVVARGQSTT